MSPQKLNILFLCSWYPNPENQSNGIFIKRHAQAISLFHQVTVIFVKSIPHIHQETITKYEDGNFKEYCVYYPKIKLNIPLIGNFLKLALFKKKYQKAIQQFSELQNFDVIHVNTIFPAAIPALYAIKNWPKAKLFITEHWSGYYPEDENYKGWFLKSITQKLVHKAEKIFVISENLKNQMIKHHLYGDYYKINNVVDTSVFKPTDAATTDIGTLKILHVSSMVNREKNISGIIEIAKQLTFQNFSFKLLIIGENHEELGYYKKTIKNYNLENKIEFLGYKTADEIAYQMNQSDVFLLFSHFEGMPVVLLESMACGLPVISTQVGEVNQMVKPSMGIILKTNTIEEAVDEIQNFKRELYSSPEEMHRHIEKNYGLQAVGNVLSELYLNT